MLGLVQDTLATPVPVSPTLAAVLLIGGLAALLFGGHGLVTAASTLARKSGISPLMIGLTIVAFGTCSPELALNLVAVAQSPEGAQLAWGNIVGSNIANVGLVLGLACLISPLTVQSMALRRDLPIVLGATGLFTALVFLPTALKEGAGLNRPEGVVLLATFLVVLSLWYRSGRSEVTNPLITELQQTDASHSKAAAVGLLLVGLVFLLAGAWAAERGAVEIAHHVGLSEAVIGLTIVAVATSLPEVATAIIASRRNENDLAVGTVLGSNLFNLVLVMGLSTMVRPIPMPTNGGITLAAMCLFAAALAWLYGPRKKLGRGWGTLVLTSWIAIVIWSVVGGSGT